MKSFRFDLGNSSVGPIGFCARIKAETPEAALEILKAALPQELAADDGFEDATEEGEIEYIRVYFNADAVTVANIDDEEDVDDEDERDLTAEQEAAIRAIYARVLEAGDGDTGESDESAKQIAHDADIDDILEELWDHDDVKEILGDETTIEVGGQYVFQSTEREPGGPGHKERSGETVTVVRPLTHDESEVEGMFKVRFADGTKADVFGDELSSAEGN